MPEYHVLRIEEQMYGCEELPAGQPRTIPYPDRELTRLGINEGDVVCLSADGLLTKG